MHQSLWLDFHHARELYKSDLSYILVRKKKKSIIFCSTVQVSAKIQLRDMEVVLSVYQLLHVVQGYQITVEVGCETTNLHIETGRGS